VAHRALAYLPPPLKKVPSDLAEAVERAMHKNAARRFDSMHDFAEALRKIRDRLLLGYDPHATPSGASRLRLAELMRGTRRTLAFVPGALVLLQTARLLRRPLRIAAAAAIIAVFAVGILWARSGGPPIPEVRPTAPELSRAAAGVADFAEVNSTWFLIVNKPSASSGAPRSAAFESHPHGASTTAARRDDAAPGNTGPVLNPQELPESYWAGVGYQSAPSVSPPSSTPNASTPSASPSLLPATGPGAPARKLAQSSAAPAAPPAPRAERTVKPPTPSAPAEPSSPRRASTAKRATHDSAASSAPKRARQSASKPKHVLPKSGL
jgi:hypothetical protein